MPRPLSALTVLAVALALMSCSSDPVTAGGSDLPNGTLALVTGTVIGADGGTVDSAEVTLRRLAVTPAGDSVIAEYVTHTDGMGAYALEDIPAGRYALLATGASDGISLNQFVEISEGVDTVLAPLEVAPAVTLVGFLELPPGYFYSRASVSVPGIGVRAWVDVNRMYVLSGVPQAEFDLVFTYGDIANYLHIAVERSTPDDSVVTMRNVAFAVMDVMGGEGNEFHESDMSRSFAITPLAYEQGHEPSWYTVVELDRVTYYAWDNDELVEWVPEQNTPSTEYDMLLAGMVYVGGDERVLLETTDGRVVQLSGIPLTELPDCPVYVTVAVLVQSRGTRTVYEVVDFFIYSPSGVSKRGAG